MWFLGFSFVVVVVVVGLSRPIISESVCNAYSFDSRPLRRKLPDPLRFHQCLAVLRARHRLLVLPGCPRPLLVWDPLLRHHHQPLEAQVF